MEKQPGRADAAAEPEGVPGRCIELRQVVLDHYQDVYRYAFRLVGTASDAEDLTQQTFLIAHRKLHQLRQTTKLKSWLFAVVRSCFLKSFRRQRPISGLGLDVDEIPDREVSADDLDRDRLQGALNELPDEFKMVVVMFYFEGLSYKEIASQLGLPPGTVMSRLSRAKGRLRQKLLVGDGGSQQPTRDAVPQTKALMSASALPGPSPFPNDRPPRPWW